MVKRLFLLLSIICLFCLGILGLKSQDKLKIISYLYRSLINQVKVNVYADELVYKTIMRKGTYDTKVLGWNNDPIVHNWNYCDGMMMLALLKTGHKKFVDDFYNDNIYYDGTVNDTRNKRNIYVNGTVDDVAPARTLFYLLDSPKSKKYRYNIDMVYNELSMQPILPDVGNNYYHKINNKAWVDYPFGLDGLYMSLPFLLEYDKAFFNQIKPGTANDIFNKLNWVSENLLKDVGLYNHGCKSDGKTMNGIVWLRGVGWYAMAQVDIINMFPKGPQKEILKQQLKRFFDGMLPYQDMDTGLWYNIIYPENQNVECNYLEASGSAMMAYALLSAYIEGFVQDEKYAYAGLKAFNGVVENKLKMYDFNYNLTDIYKSAIINEDAESYCKCENFIKNDSKGSAPLILASTIVPKVVNKLFINTFSLH